MVTLSTMEAEYVAASLAARETVWRRILFSDIGSRCVKETVFNIDNQSAIKLTKNPEFPKRNKHIDVRCHFVSECYARKVIEPVYVSTD